MTRLRAPLGAPGLVALLLLVGGAAPGASLASEDTAAPDDTASTDVASDDAASADAVFDDAGSEGAGSVEAEVIAPDVVSGAAPPPVEAQPGATPKPGETPEWCDRARELCTRPADLRLVVTGGIDGGREGTETFFDAQLFRGGHGLPLKVVDANARAVRTDDGLFFTPDKRLSDEDLARLYQTPTTSRQRRRVLVGPSAIGVLPGSHQGTASLRRGLAAVSHPAALERRVLDGRVVFGLDLTPDDPLAWPDDETPRERVPAVSAALERDDGGESAVFLLARQKGATARVFGIVDELLAEPDAPPTAFVDVGGALTGAKYSDAATAKGIADLLVARQPAVLGVGRAELTALSQDPKVLERGPYLAALEPENPDEKAAAGIPPSFRAVDIGGRRVLFVALGGASDRSRALLPEGVRALSAGQTIERAGTQARRERASLVLGVALSAEGADAALTSSIFDGVLHLASSRLAALPAVDDIDLSGNHAARLHAGPGLVRVSSADVTEVSYWFDETGRVERLRIERHPVVDGGVEAADALAVLAARRGADVNTNGLPARALLGGGGTAWTSDDLDALNGALAREALSAEVALVPRAGSPPPVFGPVPAPLARGWLAASARLVAVEVKGSELERVLAISQGRAFAMRFALTGADADGKTIAQRALAPLESYRVAITLEAIEALEQLGVKLSVDEEALRKARPLGSIVDERLARGLTPLEAERLIAAPRGRATPSLFFELSDVAVSFSYANVEGNEPFTAVRDARVQTPDTLSIGVNGRAALLYDGPYFAGGLIGSSQFTSTTQTLVDRSTVTKVTTEPRDQILLEADLKLQLPRLLGSSTSFTPLPNARLSYQTEWTPNVTDGVEQPRRSELRGLLGASLQPTPWLKELRLGLILENDFAAQHSGGLEWGAEAALAGEWRIGMLTAKLDSYVRGYVPDPKYDTEDDVGLVWQTVARLELPAFLGLNVSVFADNYTLLGKLPSNFGPANSLILGAALSYGSRAKWLPFR